MQPPSPPLAKKAGKKPKTKKQYLGDLDADAAKLIAMFGEVVKPFKIDNSGSKTDFTATAKKLLSSGVTYDDLERAARNYATVRLVEECKKRNPEEQVQFRWGFQTFYGPKHKHWRDHVSMIGADTDTVIRSSGDLSDLPHKVEYVEAKHGPEWAKRYDAQARILKSTIATDEWLKKELPCQRV